MPSPPPPSPRALTAVDRNALLLITLATLSNPFSDERAQADELLAASDAAFSATLSLPKEALAAHARSRSKKSNADRIARVRARVEARMASLMGRGIDLRTLRGSDRELFEASALFTVFHRYADGFDAYIRDQLVAGDRVLPLPFAREVMADLVAFGFPHAETARHVAIFFQMRRAFYFVDTTLAGTSPSMRRLRERLWSNIFTNDLLGYVRGMWQRMEDFSTLLLGETGSGKGAAAAAIGRSGFIPFDERSRLFKVSFTESFLAINLSQYAESLIESELFGHKRGAFTGALETHVGVFGRSSAHGAIFLDEIGETSIPTQIKLLRVLQDRTFTPVGMHEPVRFEGRVIAATNRSLNEQRRKRRFRDDFYYRLSSDVIDVPPLRTRLAEDPSELEVLLRIIVRRILGRDSEVAVTSVGRTIDRDVGPAYKWPGNVRELEQCVRRILLRGSYQGEDTGDLGPSSEGGAPGKASAKASPSALILQASNNGKLDADALLARYCAALHLELGTYEQVARRTGLDRRTVKKYILMETKAPPRVSE